MNNSILEEIYPCNIFSEGCLGIKCNDGYEGILCSNCKDGSNSYKNILGECHDCPEKHFTLLKSYHLLTYETNSFTLIAHGYTNTFIPK